MGALVGRTSIRKPISEYKIRLKSLNVLLRRSCPFVFFEAHVICALHALKNKTIVSAALNKIKRSCYVFTVLLFEIFVLEYLQNKVVDSV